MLWRPNLQRLLVGPLMRFCKYCYDIGEKPWPLREALTHLRSCLIAMSFAKHVLGLFGAADVLESGRVRGVMTTHYRRKRLLRQRDLLTVAQVLKLEQYVMNEKAAPADRVAAGFSLVCVFGRLRFSDALINSLVLDVVPTADGSTGFLEATGTRTKITTSV